jgi:LPXTG-motif cell wall-anchored protein
LDIFVNGELLIQRWTLGTYSEEFVWEAPPGEIYATLNGKQFSGCYWTYLPETGDIESPDLRAAGILGLAGLVLIVCGVLLAIFIKYVLSDDIGGTIK